MSDRIAEFVEQLKRYLREAGGEWADSVDDSPPSHVYTAAGVIVLWEIVKWFV